MKNVQIPEDLFYKICYYFYDYGFSRDELEPEIRRGLDKKMDSIINRKNYEEYLLADTDEEKERARLKYLIGKGIDI